eukprot:765236-Hanusia_phi.AAC.1
MFQVLSHAFGAMDVAPPMPPAAVSRHVVTLSVHSDLASPQKKEHHDSSKAHATVNYLVYDNSIERCIISTSSWG